MIWYVTWMKYGSRLRPGIKAALILLALLTICFFPFIAGNKTFLESSRGLPSIMPQGSWAGNAVAMNYLRTRDAAAPAFCGEPWMALIKDEYLNQRTLPLWNPYQGFGAPLAANMQSQVFNPVTVAFALIHSPRTYNFYILLRLFVAGYFAYLFLREFVSFIPALAAGVSSMFAGYYLLYLTIPHLSVEVMLPSALWAAEGILRKPGYRSTGCLAIVTFFILIGGMPESSLLALTVTYAYLVFRTVTETTLRKRVLTVGSSVIAATVGGIGCSAILLVPFRQFLRYSFNTHQAIHTGAVTGLQHDVFGLSIFTYLFPFLYGPGWTNPCTNFAGVVALFLILIAVLEIKWKSSDEDRTLTLLTCFFASVVVCAVAKRYGFPLINWVGTLPAFSLVIYPKYAEAPLSIGVAMLCGIGLERLLTRRVAMAKQVAALLISFLTIPAALAFSKDVVMKELAANNASSGLVIWTVALPVCLLVILMLSLMGMNSRRLVGVSVMAVLLCEVTFSYMVPTLYLWNELPTDTDNPYVGAPYIDQLKQWTGQNRIFAKRTVLYPNWSSAFELRDIRNLDALSYWRYLAFIRNFFRLEPHQFDGTGELLERFTGNGVYSFSDYMQQRLLQLSSVKYVVSTPDEKLKGANLVADAGQGKLPATTLKIGNIEKTAVGGQAPYQLRHKFQVDNQRRTFHFSYGINPGVSAYACGDGAEFVVEARVKTGDTKKLFSNFIDPKHDTRLRKWMDGKIDLSGYSGSSVELLFEANGGPKGDTCGDWAYWSDLDFGSETGAELFKLVYDREVRIFEVNHVVPRAAVFHDAELAASDKAVLDRLVDPGLDVFKTVMMNRTGLSGDDAKWIEGLKNSSDQAVEEAEIVSYSPREVVIRASLKRRGILVLNDSNFPGWKVTVDGAPRKVLDANFLFRGVLLEPGEHVVKFRYQPWSVTLGASISGASFACFAGVGIWRRRRKL